MLSDPRFNPEFITEIEKDIFVFKEEYCDSEHWQTFKRDDVGIYRGGSLLNIQYAISNKCKMWQTLSHSNNYGVCDNVEQVLKKYKRSVVNSKRKFFIALTSIRKDEQTFDGWRWERWGDYIGTQNKKADYLYDEPEIEEVLVYHIIELLD